MLKSYLSKVQIYMTKDIFWNHRFVDVVKINKPSPLLSIQILSFFIFAIFYPKQLKH